MLDFRNYDGIKSKLLNTPVITAFLTMIFICVAVIGVHAHDSKVGAMTVVSCLLQCVNTLKMVDYFVFLMSVERGLMALPKFLENDVDTAKKLLEKVIVMDEYMALLHIRRILDKQDKIKAGLGSGGSGEGPSYTAEDAHAVAFGWAHLDVSVYNDVVPDHLEDGVVSGAVSSRRRAVAGTTCRRPRR